MPAIDRPPAGQLCPKGGGGPLIDLLLEEGENFVQRPKQPIKRTAPLKKIIAAALSTLFLFSLSGCFFFGGTDWSSTDLLKDGEYDFIDPKETVTWLMEHAKAGDVDGIYQVFSPKAKDTANNLREKIEEFIAFVDREMVSYEWYMGGPVYTKSRDEGIMQQRELEFFIQTKEIRYRCYIDDVVMDDFDPTNVGFNSVVVVPEELYGFCTYGNFSDDGLGVFLSYQGKSRNEAILDNLLNLAGSKDSNGIYDLFSEYAKENTPDLQKQVQALTDFFDKPIRSWEFDNSATEWVRLPGTDKEVLRRMALFLLHTDKETYTMQIRDLLDGSEEGKNLGLYSIAVSTDQFRGNNKDLGWRVPGVALYQLTIYADRESLDTNGGTVRFTTSIEATVTCEEKGIVPKQIDALTWEATLTPEHTGMNTFIATAGDEQVVYSIYIEEQKDQP